MCKGPVAGKNMQELKEGHFGQNIGSKKRGLKKKKKRGLIKLAG